MTLHTRQCGDSQLGSLGAFLISPWPQTSISTSSTKQQMDKIFVNVHKLRLRSRSEDQKLRPTCTLCNGGLLSCCMTLWGDFKFKWKWQISQGNRQERLHGIGTWCRMELVLTVNVNVAAYNAGVILFTSQPYGWRQGCVPADTQWAPPGDRHRNHAYISSACSITTHADDTKLKGCALVPVFLLDAYCNLTSNVQYDYIT